MLQERTYPNGEIVRRARKGDLERFFGDEGMENSPSVRAWVGEKDGKVIVLGGIARGGDGRWYGFFDIKDAARCYDVLIARWARDGLKEFKEQGVKYIYATQDLSEKTAGKWLKKLGFHVDPRSKLLYRWKNEELV